MTEGEIPVSLRGLSSVQQARGEPREGIRALIETVLRQAA
jgi:hypothetical protein